MSQAQRPRVSVILNATSGPGCPQDRPQTVAALFRDRGMEAHVALSRSGEDVMAAVQAALDGGATLVVAGGGDGTVSAVASLVTGTQATLGVLPLGTLNHFAKDLGLPLDLEGAIDVIASGRTARIDVGDVNGRTFINNSSIGIYPDIVLDRERQRQRLGRSKWPALAIASLHAFRRFPVLSVELDIDGKQVMRRTAFVFIGNNRYAMAGFDIGARERLDEGRLSLYTTHRTGRFGLLRLAFSALLGRLRQEKDFDAVMAREVLVRTQRRRIRVATDGEVVVMNSPLRYRVRAGELSVRVPAQEKTP